MRERSTRTQGGRRSRLLRLVVLVLRVLVVLVSVELSGVTVVACDDAGDGCCTDCPVENNGKECPPGCPNCHCSHGGVSLPPAFESTPITLGRINTLVMPAPYEASVPRAPPVPGVYRPPRSLPAFS